MALEDGSQRAHKEAGCGNGFGFALAKGLSSEGYLVFAGCRDSQCQGAKELSKLENVKVLQMDIMRDVEVEEAFRTAMRTSWTLFVAFSLLLWNLRDSVPLLEQLGGIVGSVTIIPLTAHWLARLAWKAFFVKHLPSNGKSVLITGCGNGIGFALAKRLSTEGFLVFAGCRDSKCQGAKELSRLKNIRVLQMDISRDEEVEEAFATIDTELGLNALWSVVANAGVRTDGLLEWHTMDSIVKIFNVNVFGTLRVIKKFLPMLKRSKGRVIVMNSPLGHVTIPMEVPYCMTKHALVSMVDGFRRECQGKGVVFINMEPSAYKTQITANFGDPDLVEQDLLRQPPDVRADYSTEAVQRWLQFPKILFDTINRDNLDEAVDPIVLAIREVDPDTCYVSPWRLGSFLTDVLRILPSELADLAFGAALKLLPFLYTNCGFRSNKT
ncbi:D-beta-hydroxybutyrate dehydrogenase, mitochondrial-like [Amblyomma americanum]